MPPQGQYQYRRLISVAAIFLLLALALRLWQRESRRTALPQTQVVPATIQASAPQTAPALTVMATRTNNPTDASARGLQEMFGSIKTVKDAKAARQSLAELRRALSVRPTAAAVAAIRQFLDSKEDASTHLGFKVAGSGLLDEAPTLRTFLLDELARLDPAAAADYAKVVLANMDSPDEWAVALRNLALGNTSTEARALLLQKTEQMLQYAPW